MGCHGLMSVCVNNHRVTGSLTGAYGVANDVDDDTGYAEIGHPGKALLLRHMATKQPVSRVHVGGFQRITNIKETIPFRACRQEDAPSCICTANE